MDKPYCSCGGRGTYLDRRCVERVCAHLNAPIKVTTSTTKCATYGHEKVKTKIKRGKVMDCPTRTCVCYNEKHHRSKEITCATPTITIQQAQQRED